MQLCTDLLIQINSTGINENRCTWVHPQVAINIAQWISPEFDVQVSRWIYELAITGSFTVGQEKSDEQLLELHKRLKDEQSKNKNLEKKHTLLLKRRTYHKFKKGPVFYVISDTDSSTTRYKVGIDSVDFNARLVTHRTSIPSLKVDYLIYSDKNGLIESAILERYKENRKLYLNHEWIYDIELTHLIDSVQKLVDFLGIEATQDTDLDEYNK